MRDNDDDDDISENFDALFGQAVSCGELWDPEQEGAGTGHSEPEEEPDGDDADD